MTMKNYFSYIVCCLLILSSCNDKPNEAGKSASNDLYTCSMHPQVLEHHPGNCPICGMELVKKNQVAATTNSIELETLLKPANESVIASLPITTPQQKSISVPVKLYGTIEYDTRAAGSISARVSGRIDKLYLRYRYQEVSKGQKVLDIYSPEMVTAEQNLLFLLKNDPGNSSFISVARQRLLLMGLTERELAEIVQTGKPLYDVGVYSNYSGHVHDAGMSSDAPANDMENNAGVTGELSLKEGMYVQKGQALFMIMNHHQVWAALQIFPNQQEQVKINDAVRVVPETDTSEIISGKIDFIEPFFRSNSKTLTARVFFDNMNMLPVGSHVVAEVYSGSVRGLWLPATAVVSLGQSEVVFIKQGPGFIAHKISTGVRADNNIQILSGLNAVDTVATNGQYLIDSESFIKTGQ